MARSKHLSKTIACFAALLFFTIVGISVLTTDLSMLIPMTYLLMSVITFIFYAIDKSAAISSLRRIPETNLHSLALLGGWPGALVAQQFLRHKTQKKPFRTFYWFTLSANCGCLIWLHTSDGRALMAPIDAFAHYLFDNYSLGMPVLS